MLFVLVYIRLIHQRFCFVSGIPYPFPYLYDYRISGTVHDQTIDETGEGEMLQHRNFLPLKIRDGTGCERVLCTYIHFLPEDLLWANAQQANGLLQEIANVIIHNFDEISLQAEEIIESDSNNSFTRMPRLPLSSKQDKGSSFAISYATHSSLQRKSCLGFRGNSWTNVKPISWFTFELSLWVIRLSNENQNDRGILSLPLDCLYVSDIY